MTDDFRQKMDRKSDDDIFRKVSFDKGFDKYKRHKDKISIAMRGTHEGDEMKICDGGGSLCGSIFCEKCGKKKQSGMYYSYKKRFYIEINGNETLARKRFRWVSVLHNAIPVNVETLDDEIQTLNCVMASVEQMKGQISLLGKEADRLFDGDSGLWMRGGVHIEIIDYASYKDALLRHGKATAKETTLKAFVDETSIRTADYMFLVHFHGLFDMGRMNEEDFKTLFKKRWNMMKRQTHITQMWEKISVIKKDANGRALRDDNGKLIRERKIQDVRHALRGMANYCFSWSNINLEYKQNWGTGRYKSIRDFMVEIEDKSNIKRMTQGHIRLLVKAHSLVNGSSHRGLIVSVY
jgi:hypothetical protein